MTNMTRRNFLEALGLTAGAMALPGCKCPFCGGLDGKIAVQLYSIHAYIGKLGGNRAALEKTLAEVAKIGYTGIEFAGYYGCKAQELRKMLDDNGLKACGTHVGRGAFGPEEIKKTCEFNLAYGNNFICCPGGGNFPGKGEKLDDFLPKLCDYYNKAAETAKTYGCKIGLHNHTGEFGSKMSDGTTYWDYFFSHTSKDVCMEQDIGWTTAAKHDPVAQWEKYPFRSPTLHAKENCAGPGFQAILGQPGSADGKGGVDWDKAIVGAEKNGIEWWVVECERHFEDLDAITPSYAFLKSKGLN